MLYITGLASVMIINPVTNWGHLRHTYCCHNISGVSWAYTRVCLVNIKQILIVLLSMLLAFCFVFSVQFLTGSSRHGISKYLNCVCTNYDVSWYFTHSVFYSAKFESLVRDFVNVFDCKHISMIPGSHCYSKMHLFS